jgi:hypothetical protein
MDKLNTERVQQRSTRKRWKTRREFRVEGDGLNTHFKACLVMRDMER